MTSLHLKHLLPCHDNLSRLQVSLCLWPLLLWPVLWKGPRLWGALGLRAVSCSQLVSLKCRGSASCHAQSTSCESCRVFQGFSKATLVHLYSLEHSMSYPVPLLAADHGAARPKFCFPFPVAAHAGCVIWGMRSMWLLLAPFPL